MSDVHFVRIDNKRDEGTTGVVILNWEGREHFIIPGNIWQNLVAFLFVTMGEKSASIYYIDDRDTPIQCTERPPQ